MMTSGGALSEAPFIIALITVGSIDCPSITLATQAVARAVGGSLRLPSARVHRRG